MNSERFPKSLTIDLQFKFKYTTKSKLKEDSSNIISYLTNAENQNDVLKALKYKRIQKLLFQFSISFSFY